MGGERMARHDLNRRALEHAIVLCKDGHYASDEWAFSADDSNALLGEKGKETWSEYGQWFLGVDTNEDAQSKAHYAYPFGKGATLNLGALKAIIAASGKAS